MEKYEKNNSNSLYKARGWLFLSVLIVMLMSIQVISAFEFDNVIRFDKDAGTYGTYTVKNIFGIGSDLAIVELTDNTDSCSENCYAEGTTTLYIEEQLMQQVRFKDKKKTKYKNIKEYDFYIEDGFKEKIIKDYKTTCTTKQYTNGTNYKDCIRKEIGEHIEYETKWKKYNGEIMPVGTYKWRLEGKKEAKETVDWTIDFFGFESTRWALWTGNEAPFVYWKFDESTGTNVPDVATGITYDGTANGIGDDHWVAGLINNALRLDKVSSISGSYVRQATLLDTVPSSNDFSFQLWFKTAIGFDTSESTNQYLLQKDNVEGADRMTLRLDSTSGKLTFFYEAGDSGPVYGYGTDTSWDTNWHQIVVVVDGSTDFKVYVDGVLNDTTAYAHTLQDGSFTDFNIGIHQNALEPFNGTVDEFGIWNRTLSDAEVLELWNGGAGETFPLPNTTILQTVNIYRPINNSNHSTNTIEINCSGASPFGMRNLSIYLDGVLNYTEFNTTVQNISYNKTLDILDGTHEVWCRGGDAFNNHRNTTIVPFEIDTTSPDIKIDYPNQSFTSLPNPLYLNWTVFDSNLDQCWYEYDGVNTSVSCLDNATTFTPSTVTTLRMFANDTFGHLNSNTTTWNYTILVANELYNATSYETDSERFVSIINADGAEVLTGTLVYDGVEYAGTKTGSDILAYFSKVIDIPTGPENKTWYWVIDYGTTKINLTTHEQTVQQINWGICNSSNSGVRFNITFKDEDTGAWITNGTLPTTNWNYYLGSGDVKKSYSYDNTVAHSNYTFCFSENQSEILYTNYSINYKDADGYYPQRSFSATSGFTNVTTDKILYLLSSTDGIYVTFQVVNSADQPLTGVSVEANRTIAGLPYTVGSGITGADGGITFWLNPDYPHTFTFEHPNYEIYQTTFTPTQNSYTVTLGAGDDNPLDDFNQGISYSILPINTTLINNQTYTFSFILTSSVWTIEEFGFQLFNSSGALVASDIETTDGGTATKNYVVNNNTDYIQMKYYYVITGNYSNFTRTWAVLSSGGDGWSINNFFNDFTSYTNVGMFGLGNFGKALIVFIIIFIFTGIMSYKFGLVSPTGITTLVFSLVLFFDVGVGWFEIINPTAIPYFPTIFMGIILMGVLFKEVYK